MRSPHRPQRDRSCGSAKLKYTQGPCFLKSSDDKPLCFTKTAPAPPMCAIDSSLNHRSGSSFRIFLGSSTHSQASSAEIAHPLPFSITRSCEIYFENHSDKEDEICYNQLCANVAQLVEQRIRNARVKGSSPFIGSIRGVAQFGSAFGSGPKGRGFKSRRPDQIKNDTL